MAANRKIYEALADAFVAEGVDTVFGLMGDGNMHWMTALTHRDGVKVFHARHEHCACAMAMGYHSATGKVGVASVTCGPGFTQIMTALTTSARGNVPLVVFAGETPLSSKWDLQWIDQQPFAAACGAHYISAHNAQRMHQYVRDAFYLARYEQKTVVLGVPYDLQKQMMPDSGPYVPSETLAARLEAIPPSPRQVERLADKLRNAKCPIIVGGRGVIQSEARKEVEKLAETSGALLGTTLLAKGLYDHNPFSLGVVGGFARAITKEIGKKSDLVLTFGASLSHHTLDGGKMFPNAEIVQIATEPKGYMHALHTADIHLRADARLTALAMLDALGKQGASAAQIRTPELARRIKDEPADSMPYPITAGTVDPRDMTSELETVIPQDYDVVAGSGHQSYFHTVMRGTDPTQYHSMKFFGAIGNAISFATGVAVARGNGKVVLYEGDGSLLMHIQELEAIKRQGVKFLIVVGNDGAYGSEIHKLRKEGIDDSAAIFGRTDLAAIARGFGLRGATVKQLGQFKQLLDDYERHDCTEIWDVHISDQVVNPVARGNPAVKQS